MEGNARMRHVARAAAETARERKACGNKGLGQEDFTQEDLTQEDLTQEDLTQEDLTQEDLTQEDLTQEDLTQEDLTQEDLTQEDLGGPTMRGDSILLAAWVAALLPAALGAAAAETYPARPITLVVPFAPGGSASTVARSVADKMSETLGQQIVIDNRGGAGGTLATRAVAKGVSDGYTILVATSATVGTSPSLLHNLGYDPRKDLDPIGLIAATPNVIVVHPSVPARSLAELIKIGQETATPIPYGSPGTGTLNHLT